MKNLLVLILILPGFILKSQENNTFGEEKYPEKEYIFVMRLMPDMDGNLFQLGVMKADAVEDKEIIYLSIESWSRQLIGLESSKANPLSENIPLKHKIFELKDNTYNKEEIDYYTLTKIKALLNNLWRIKYSEYPFYSLSMNNEKGWAKHPDPQITWLPSESQINILKSYGISELNDFFKNDDLYRLLRDILDSEWQNRYVQSAGVYNTQP